MTTSMKPTLQNYRFQGFDYSRSSHYMFRRGLMLTKANSIIEETINFCVDNSITRDYLEM